MKYKERFIVQDLESHEFIYPDPLSLIYFIREHLKKERSQFIIATHSPILMAMPDALIY